MKRLWNRVSKLIFYQYFYFILFSSQYFSEFYKFYKLYFKIYSRISLSTNLGERKWNKEMRGVVSFLQKKKKEEKNFTENTYVENIEIESCTQTGLMCTRALVSLVPRLSLISDPRGRRMPVAASCSRSSITLAHPATISQTVTTLPPVRIEPSYRSFLPFHRPASRPSTILQIRDHPSLRI